MLMKPTTPVTDLEKPKVSLFAPRRKIYPKLAHGNYRRLKWILMAFTLGIYYSVPWLRWDRGAEMPGQAVLLDMAQERFFLFGLEIWPQEFYYVTGLLILASLGLFLVTALAGRVWCGYFCPQTVWTDLMIAVERFWEGDRNARLRLDSAPLVKRLLKRSLTHASWLVIALLTGGAFVFYFADAPTLLPQLITGSAPNEAYIFVGIFTFTTYLLGGIAREQVCTYMCPWPRIQGALVDQDTFLVTYRNYRGEPRGPHHKGASWEGRGDCVDCRACVAVCPTGIDIRDGAQLECLQCALCIDACNEIMPRVGRPTGLIAYDTIANQKAAGGGGVTMPRLLRPRTILYSSLIAIAGSIMLIALLLRNDFEVTVLPDRNPLFVRLSNGDVRNGYTLKILNKQYRTRHFALTLRNPEEGRLSVDNQNTGYLRVPPDILREFKVYVAVSKNAQNDAVILDIHDPVSGASVTHVASFRRPQG